MQYSEFSIQAGLKLKDKAQESCQGERILASVTNE
jgi:hypothetical protein